MSEASREIRSAPPTKDTVDTARIPLSRQEATARLLETDGKPYQEHRFVRYPPTRETFIVDRSVEVVKATVPVENHHKDIVARLADAGLIEDPTQVEGGYVMVEGSGSRAILSFAGEAVTINSPLPNVFEDAVNTQVDPDQIYIIDQDGQQPEEKTT